MLKKDVARFISSIIRSGIENGSSDEEIQINVVKFIAYLKGQNYVDRESLDLINKVLDTIYDLIRMAMVYGNEGLINLMLNLGNDDLEINERQRSSRREEPLVRESRNVIVTSGGCGDDMHRVRRYVSSCGVADVLDYTDSCGGPVSRGRSLGRSSC